MGFIWQIWIGIFGNGEDIVTTAEEQLDNERPFLLERGSRLSFNL